MCTIWSDVSLINYYTLWLAFKN